MLVSAGLSAREQVDGWVAAWGLAFDNRAKIFGVDRGYLSLRSPERTVREFNQSSHITTRLV